MNLEDWFSARRRRSPGRAPAAGDDLAIDPETGEVMPAGAPADESQATRRGHATSDAGSATVPGERAIPSVNRERSMQSRISSALALGTMLLLGIGFLAWYYSAQYAKAHDADKAAKRAAAERVAGDVKVPPLGPVQPPIPAVAASAATPVATADILGPPPLPPQAMQPGLAGQGDPAAKTPEQLALERQLGAPVLLRPQTAQSAGTAAPQPVTATLAGTSGLPLGGLLRGIEPGRAGEAQGGDALASLLKPTATPAVAAQLVPTRRFLLPKGAFIDCTLETAIDSTYPGMTTCIGANDIYSADGKVVLLERGTKYIGEQKTELKLGQARVFVLWDEARTPTGVVVNLASPGTDELGRSGLPGFVDTHFWDRFGAAILISLIDGTVQALAASQQQGGTSVVLNPGGTTSVLTEVLKSTVAIPPTVVKNQGDRIQILVARDVDFRPVYALRTDDNSNP